MFWQVNRRRTPAGILMTRSEVCSRISQDLLRIALIRHKACAKTFMHRNLKPLLHRLHLFVGAVPTPSELFVCFLSFFLLHRRMRINCKAELRAFSKLLSWSTKTRREHQACCESGERLVSQEERIDNIIWLQVSASFQVLETSTKTGTSYSKQSQK